MGSIQTIIASLSGAADRRADATRTKSQRVPACESLEGRALLNAGWGGAHSHGMWDGAAGAPGRMETAHVRTWGGASALDKGSMHAHGFPGRGVPATACPP